MNGADYYLKTLLLWTLILIPCFWMPIDGQQEPLKEPTAASRAVKLALDGSCSEAIPLLKQAVGGSLDQESKRLVGKAGVRCSMLLGAQGDATVFLNRLLQQFPTDPDVLFLAVHVY